MSWYELLSKEKLTWYCHICKRMRPDDKISVYSKPLIINGQVCGQENIRYCNDNLACIVAASHYSHFNGGQERSGNGPDGD